MARYRKQPRLTLPLRSTFERFQQEPQSAIYLHTAYFRLKKNCCRDKCAARVGLKQCAALLLHKAGIEVLEQQRANAMQGQRKEGGNLQGGSYLQRRLLL